jgi:Winged helix-turn helix
MRAGIVVNVTRADRLRLEAIVADRSAPQKHVWRAKVILATADGCGTAEIMRRSGKSKPVVWTWQARFMAEGVEGLLHVAGSINMDVIATAARYPKMGEKVPGREIFFSPGGKVPIKLYRPPNSAVPRH